MARNSIKILDCTLRETPVAIFGEENIKLLLRNLPKAGIEIVECAFLVDEDRYKYRAEGTHVNSMQQANELLDGLKDERVTYTVCMNQGEYDLKKLAERDPQGIDAIRYVLIEGKIHEAIDDFKLIKENGYNLFIQHRNIYYYSPDQIIEIIEIINSVGCDAYSIVDTHGSLYPQDIERLVGIVLEHLSPNIMLGFHGHNNHMLANGNAELFARLITDRDNLFFDGTVLGAGIGAGNANTEILALYCNRWEQEKYNMEYLYEIIDKVIPDIKRRCSWGYSALLLITGEYNAMCPHGQYLRRIRPDFSLSRINEEIKNLPLEFKTSSSTDCWEKYRIKRPVVDYVKGKLKKYKGTMIYAITHWIYTKVQTGYSKSRAVYAVLKS